MQNSHVLHLVPKEYIPKLDNWYFGENCWNAAMRYHDPSQPCGYTAGKDMDAWLSANTVPVQNPSIGDILVMRNPSFFGGYQCDLETDIMHTAILLEGDVMFHKKGYSGPYELRTQSEIRDIYYNATVFEWRRYVWAASAQQAA